MFCDSLGFVDLEGIDPVPDPALVMDLMHLTSVHPKETTLAGIERWHRHYVGVLYNQPKLRVIRSGRSLQHHFSGVADVVLGLQNPPQDVSIAIAAAWMYNNGICFTNLAYNVGTNLAGGYYEPTVGLTDKGKDLVRACADYGIVVDLSHSSLATMEDVMALVDGENLKTKVVVTHAGMAEVHGSPRNVPRHVGRWVVSHGGFVGIPFFTFFNGPQEADESQEAAERWYLANISYAVDAFGHKSVTLGTDTPYKHYSLEEQMAHFAKLARELDPKSLAIHGRTKTPPLQHPHGYYSYRKMPMLFELITKDVGGQIAEAVCGDNFWRWCQVNLQ